MAGYVSSRVLRLQSKAQSLTAIFHKELYNISSCGVAILAMIVRQNINELNNLPWYESSLVVWLNRVRPDGDWDYKRRYGDSKYQDLGNFNYGATGASIGFSLNILMAGGGAIATLKGQNNLGHLMINGLINTGLKKDINFINMNSNCCYCENFPVNVFRFSFINSNYCKIFNK